MRPLKVAYLVASARAGGAERQMLVLAERLPRDRFEVEFVAIAGTADYHARARAAGVEIRFLGGAPPPDASLVARIARRGLKALRYAALTRATKYDIVDAWLYPADVLAALARPYTGTPIVVAGRRNLGDVDGRLGRLQRGFGGLANRFVDAVVANSAAVAAEALAREHLDASKLQVIRNGVALIDPMSADERAERRRVMGVSDDSFVIGCVANYRSVKRLDHLIDALAGLVGEHAGLRLVLVGEGPMRGELQRQIDALGLHGHVRLHGAVPDPSGLYGAFDLVVQSSASEGLPNALLEAGAAGRPIVATAAGGTSEIVIPGQTGWLVPVNDLDALVRAIHTAIRDRPLRESLGAAAREHVRRVFGIERYVAEFAGLYESLAVAKGLRR